MKKTDKTSWMDKMESILKNDRSLNELMVGASILYGVSDPCGVGYSACAAVCGSKFNKEK